MRKPIGGTVRNYTGFWLKFSDDGIDSVQFTSTGLLFWIEGNLSDKEVLLASLKVQVLIEEDRLRENLNTSNHEDTAIPSLVKRINKLLQNSN